MWDRSYELRPDAIRRRFTRINTQPGLDPLQIGRQTTATEDTLLGGQLGVSYQIGSDHEARLTLFHTRSATHENTRIRTLDESDPGTAGVAPSNPRDDLLLHDNIHYTERRLTSYQLSGRSIFDPGTLVITRDGMISARGTRENPIIFTTAAVDKNGDGIADLGVDVDGD